MKRRNGPLVVRVSLLALAGVLIAAGIAGGDVELLFRKAVFVCLECIGIG